MRYDTNDTCGVSFTRRLKYDHSDPIKFLNGCEIFLMLKTTALRQVIVAMVIAVAAATVHGAWFAPTAALTSAPAQASIRLSTWDEFERRWTSYYIDQHVALNPSVRHAEGAIIELRPQTAGSAVDSTPGFIDVLTSAQMAELAIPLPSTVPSAEDAPYQVPAEGIPTFGRLRVSGLSHISEPRPTDHVGTWAGPVMHTEADINALDMGGSVGVYLNLVLTTDGNADQVTFTWDIGRWAKGDVMLALNYATYRVVDRHGEFKRFVVSADYDRLSWGIPTSSVTPGCAANWRTGEFFVSNFSNVEPAVNVISRHPGVTGTPGVNSRLYAPLNRRLSTVMMRDSQSLDNWDYPIDTNPESVSFDAAGNLYVGHGSPNWDWTTPPPAAWGETWVRPDYEATGEWVYWAWSIDNTPFEWLQGGKNYLVDENGVVLRLGTLGSGGPFEDAEHGFASRRLLHDENGQLVFPQTSTNYAAAGELLLPLGFYADRSTGEWMEKEGALGQRVPVRWSLGRRLHRYLVQPDGSYAGSESTEPKRDVFWAFQGRQGTDWVDLSFSPYVENQTSEVIAFYTSHDSFIHRFSVTNNRQLPDFGGGRLFPRNEYKDRGFHALRVLPPGDGTGGVVVAGGDAIFRFNQRGEYVQQYQITDDPDVLKAHANKTGLIQTFFSLQVDPTGRQLWASALETGWVYVFDIASGEVLKRIHATDFVPQWDPDLVEGRMVQGICIMWEFTAQQEICGDGIDNDGDGFIDEGCTAIEVCSALSRGDDDGDGLADNNDPDCGEDLPPVARDDTFETTQDVQLVVQAGAPNQVLVNDYDPDNEKPETILHNDLTVLRVGTSGTPDVGAGGLVTTTSGGTVVLQVDGSMLYSPPAEFHGIDTFVYQITDYTYMDKVEPPANINVSNVATVTIFVRPLVADDRYTMPERTTLDVADGSADPLGILLNDPSSPLTISAAGSSGVTPLGTNASVTFVTTNGGAVTVFATGRFTYTPLSTFIGEDTFQYQGVGNDGLTSVNIATVTIIVEDVNELIAVDDVYSTDFETPITRTLTTNDRDPEGHSFRITLINGQPVTVGNTVSVTNGTVRLDDQDGIVTITPATSFWGTLTFPYTIEDAPGASSGVEPVTATALVTVEVTAPPVTAKNDYYVTQQNTTLVTANLPQDRSILMNDTGVTTVYSLGSYTGPGSDLLLNGSPAVWTTIAGGTVTVSPDGTFVYVPPFNFVGVDSYTYNVWSPVTNRVRADVFITVTPLSTTVPVTTPDPSVYGTAATATATVTCGADQAPSVGTVTFHLDGTVIATGVPVINGVATTTLPATLVVGNYTLVAEYTGSTVEPTLCPPSSGSDGHQVVPAPLVVTAGPRSKPYGTVATFAGTEFTTDGLLFDDTVNSATLVSPTGAPASATVAGSTYPITPSAAVGTGLSNYTITYVNGQLTVTPVPLTVTADDKSKVYDGAVFGGPYTVSYSGFVLGEAHTALGGALTFSGSALTAVDVGTYTDGIVPAGYASTNYTISYEPGTLTITPPPSDPGSGVCEGGVNKLVLKYIGSGSPNGTVSGQRTAPGTGPKLGAQVSGSSPVLYTFATKEMGGLYDPVSGGRLANQFAVFIGDTQIDDVHTSCSVPIYPGMKVGTQFEIVEVWTRGGGSFGPYSETSTSASTPSSEPAPTLAPTGVADSYSVKRGQRLTVPAGSGVLANDNAPSGATAIVVTNVSRGTLTLNANGSFTYRAQGGWTGNVTFTYAVKVGSATSAPVTVTIVVTR